MSTKPPDQGSSAGGENVAAYFGQLAAANHVKKLVERYLSLAPVFIGGPANTSLEAPPPPPPAPPPPPQPIVNETPEKGMHQMQNANFQVLTGHGVKLILSPNGSKLVLLNWTKNLPNFDCLSNNPEKLNPKRTFDGAEVDRKQP